MIFTSVGVAILYFMWQSQSSAYMDECPKIGVAPEDCKLSSKLITDFREANGWWLLVICIIFMISNILRSERWKTMLNALGHNVSHANSFFAVMIGYFTNLGLPRVGEFARASVIVKYENIPFEKTFGTIILDRMIDFISLFIMLGLGFLFHHDTLINYLVENLNIPTNLLLGATIFGIAMLGVAIAGWMRINNRDEDQLHPILVKVRNLIYGFVEGLGTIRKLPNLPVFILQSIGIWLCYFLMHYFAFFAYLPTSHLTALDGLLVFDFSSLGMIFPSPGGMGSYHAMVVEGLQILGVPSLQGFSFAMICFFTLNIFCNVAFGLLSLLMLPILNKK